MLCLQKTDLLRRPLGETIAHFERLLQALHPEIGLEYVSAQVPAWVAKSLLESARYSKGDDGLARIEAEQCGLNEDLPILRGDGLRPRLTGVVSVARGGEAERVCVGLLKTVGRSVPEFRWLFSAKVFGVNNAWEIARTLQRQMDHLCEGEEVSQIPEFHRRFMEFQKHEPYDGPNDPWRLMIEERDDGQRCVASVFREQGKVIDEVAFDGPARLPAARTWLGDWFTLLTRQQARSDTAYHLVMTPELSEAVKEHCGYAWREAGAKDLAPAADEAANTWCRECEQAPRGRRS